MSLVTVVIVSSTVVVLFSPSRWREGGRGVGLAVSQLGTYLVLVNVCGVTPSLDEEVLCVGPFLRDVLLGSLGLRSGRPIRRTWLGQVVVGSGCEGEMGCFEVPGDGEVECPQAQVRRE